MRCSDSKGLGKPGEEFCSIGWSKRPKAECAGRHTSPLLPGLSVAVAIGASRAPGLPQARDWVVRPLHTFMTMTTTQAQEFVARWRRILIPWRAVTDAQAVRDMERSCVGIIGGMVLVVACSTTLPVTWKLPVAVTAFVIAALAFWLSLRLRAVRRLFDAAGPQSFSDLK